MPNDNILLPRHPAGATYQDYIIMTIPLYIFSSYLYGVRPLFLALIAIVTANLCDRAVCAIRRIPRDNSEISSIAFALLVVLMLPANVPYYIAIMTVLFTVLIGKAAFGGYGFYVFSPVAVGFCISVVSWPQQIFSYALPNTMLPLFTPITTQITQAPLSALKAGGRPTLNLLDLLLGNYASAMGITSVIILLSCGAYMWMKKRITLYIPLIYIGVCGIIAFLFPRIGGYDYSWGIQTLQLRASSVMYELLGGIIIFAAIFLINDEVTLPKRRDARVVYAVILAIFTMAFRYFGFYEIGMCFALICVNAVSLSLDSIMSHIFKRVKINMQNTHVTEAANERTN